MLTAVATLAAVFGVGVASALIPVVNAELALGAVAAVSSWPLALGAAVSIAAGQTAGKIVIFEAARAGGARWLERVGRRVREPGTIVPGSPTPAPHAKEPSSRWRVPLAALTRGRWTAAVTVLVAGVVGLPPLALVSIGAGAGGMRRADFAVCCCIGRTVRFCALAVAVPTINDIPH